MTVWAMRFDSIKKRFRFGIIALVFLFSVPVLYLSWAILHGSSIPAALIRAYTKTQILFSFLPKATVFLPVKFDKQDRRLSCEAAGLKMLLAYKGIDVAESELLEKIGVDSAPKSRVMNSGEINGELVWGDPDRAFVGNVDGTMFVDGYGVYAAPIERVANEYRLASRLKNPDVSDIVAELLRGNPVMVWGYLGSGKIMSWKTSEGRSIPAVYYEHIFVVNGFSGSASDPDGFHVIDTIYGLTYFSKETFLKKWDALGKMAVVIY